MLLLTESILGLFKLQNLTANFSKLFISLSLGIGLGLFLMASFLSFAYWDIPIGFASIIPFMLGVVWSLKERKKIGFGAITSIFTIVLIPIAIIPLVFIYGESLGIFLQTGTITGLALHFLGSGFFAIGLIRVYIEKRPKQLGFFFTILSLLFLIGVIIVNIYQVLASRFGSTWVATPYQGYTISLILVSGAFFLLSCVSFLHMKLGLSKSVEETTIISQERNHGDHTNEKRDGIIWAKKFCISYCDTGFILLIFSSLSLIFAAVLYAPAGPFMGSIPRTSSRELTLPLIIFSIASLTLGFNFILFKRVVRFGFLLGILGSFFLIASSFVDGYDPIVNLLDIGFVPMGSGYINPLGEYASLLFLTSLPFLVIGYTIMLRNRRKIASSICTNDFFHE